MGDSSDAKPQRRSEASSRLPQGSSFPTGEQYTIRYGDQVVSLTEVGGGLRSYEVAGQAVLDGFAAESPCTGGRGQTLLPWPNRLRGGRYPWGGVTQQLDLSEPARGGAIHGLTRWANWRVLEQGTASIRLGYVLHVCPGWPFTLGCEITYALEAAGLSVRTSVTNLGREACPYGSGAHPYLAVGRHLVDDAHLRIPARRFLRTDEVGIPVGSETVDGTPLDFRTFARIGTRQLDVTYADLLRDPDGRVRVWLRLDEERDLAVWFDEAYAFVQVYSGDTLPEVERRRRGLAIEPMTCPPDAFNSGVGLRVLRPGEVHQASWGITPSRSAAPIA